MWACGAVATCVWSAYSLRPSHFVCLRGEGIQLTRMNGVRASVFVFYPEDVRLNPPQGVRLSVHARTKTNYGGRTVCPPIATW